MAKDNDSLLKEARDRLASVIKHDSENRKEAAIDHAFLAGACALRLSSARA